MWLNPTTCFGAWFSNMHLANNLILIIWLSLFWSKCRHIEQESRITNPARTCPAITNLETLEKISETLRWRLVKPKLWEGRRLWVRKIYPLLFICSISSANITFCKLMASISTTIVDHCIEPRVPQTSATVEMSSEELRKHFVIPPSIEFESYIEDLADAGKSKINRLIIPVESFRLGLQLPLCPNLLAFDSFEICHAHLYPITRNFLICFLHLCRQVKILLSLVCSHNFLLFWN